MKYFAFPPIAKNENEGVAALMSDDVITKAVKDFQVKIIFRSNNFSTLRMRHNWNKIISIKHVSHEIDRKTLIFVCQLGKQYTT